MRDRNCSRLSAVLFLSVFLSTIFTNHTDNFFILLLIAVWHFLFCWYLPVNTLLKYCIRTHVRQYMLFLNDFMYIWYVQKCKFSVFFLFEILFESKFRLRLICTQRES